MVASERSAQLAADADVKASASAPLRRPMFRAIWIANLVSNMGTWMHDVGAGWLMTDLAPDPFMVSLVQSAVVFPVFFLAMPAGALADIVDRRLYMMTGISWMVLIAGALAATAMAGAVTPLSLLLFTFGLGCGSAMLMPAFASLVPDLVPRSELTAAVTLNGIGMNLTRAVGPALAGVVVAAAGPGVVFAFNAVSFLGLLVVMFNYHSLQPRSTLPSERFVGALRMGLRFARQSPALHVVLARGVAFFIMVSPLWAFIPLIVRQELGAGPQTYGLMVTSVGAGAVVMGLLLTRFRARFSSDTVVAVGTVAAAAALMGLAYIRVPALLMLTLFIAGGAWISVLSTLQVAAQLALPAWVRARGLSIFLGSFMGSTAIGAASWGKLASATDIQTALDSAVVVGLLLFLVVSRWRISQHANVDRTMVEPLPDPSVSIPLDDTQGPVMIQIKYRIRPEDAVEFEKSMRDVRRMRLRNGAVAWGLFQDTDQAEQFVETFVAESWLEHLRQHQRLTVEDLEFKQHAERFHQGGEPPVVRHFIARTAPKRRYSRFGRRQLREPDNEAR
jgi:MFS family permease